MLSTEVLLTAPAQPLYETGGTFADGSGEVNLIDAANGCSENLHLVSTAEREPGDEKMRLSPSRRSITGEMSFRGRAAQHRNAYLSLRSSNIKMPSDQRSAEALWPLFKMISGAM